MSNEKILHLEPILKEYIWGGSKLRSEFGYDIPSDRTGECWAISAHKNGDCIIKSGIYSGKHLSELWNEHRELFGNYSSSIFPLLIKIIDAQDNLSIQVHPNDAYAERYSPGSLGKTECWLILDCDRDADIIIGHNAKDSQEVRKMIEAQKWEDFIREIPIKKGDFFQIEPGCVHAIKKGTLILEIQQNSDITFRVYDYDRLQNNKPRELHIKESIDCIKAPYKERHTDITEKVTEYGRYIHYISCDFYNVDRYIISKNANLIFNNAFTCVSVIAGAGSIDGEMIKKGDHLILTSDCKSCNIEGTLDMVCSYPPQK